MNHYPREIKLRIDLVTGQYSHYPRSNGPRPRPKRDKGHWKRNAWEILNEIFPGGQRSIGNLSGAEVWLLLNITPCKSKAHKHITAKQNFLKAIAKDLGLQPAPKWWKVRKRLLGGIK